MTWMENSYPGGIQRPCIISKDAALGGKSIKKYYTAVVFHDDENPTAFGGSIIIESNFGEDRWQSPITRLEAKTLREAQQTMFDTCNVMMNAAAWREE